MKKMTRILPHVIPKSLIFNTCKQEKSLYSYIHITVCNWCVVSAADGGLFLWVGSLAVPSHELCAVQHSTVP